MTDVGELPLIPRIPAPTEPCQLLLLEESTQYFGVRRDVHVYANDPNRNGRANTKSDHGSQGLRVLLHVHYSLKQEEEPLETIQRFLPKLGSKTSGALGRTNRNWQPALRAPTHEIKIKDPGEGKAKPFLTRLQGRIKGHRSALV